MPTPRHLSEVLAARQGPSGVSSEVAVSGQGTDPSAWVAGTIEASAGDLANSYTVSLADGTTVEVSSVLDGTPLAVGDTVWLVQGPGRLLIAGLK